MGVVQRQGVSSTVISYIGAVLGYVNKMVLFTHFLSLEEVGLANTMPVIAVMIAQFAAIGTPNSILRFFPYFRDREKHHNGFLAGFLLLSLIGFIVIGSLFWIFRPFIFSIWEEKSPLLFEYGYLLLPYALSYVVINVFEAYLRSLYKIAFMTFVKEIGLRLAVTIAISLFAFGVIDFSTFVHIYIAVIVLTAVAPVLYTLFIGELLLKPQFGTVWKKHFNEIIRYTFVTFLPIAGSTVLHQLDIFMLSFESETLNGIYTTLAFAATIIVIPWKALRGISAPLVVEHWKNKDMEKMKSLYRRTSLISLMTGTFIFLGLWLNRHNLIAIIGEKYAIGIIVLAILGLSKVWDMTTGLNGVILITSPKYIYDLFFQIGLIVIGISSNLILIPRLGINGAAIATFVSIFFINTARMITVWRLFNLHPFTDPMLKVVVGGILTYYICDAFPTLVNFWWDIPLRSFLCTVLFAGLMLKWEVSPDVNAYVMKWGAKLGVGRILQFLINTDREKD